MTRATPVGLRDADDDYSFGVLRGDVERLEITRLQTERNLADLADVAVARTNLGLGTQADIIASLGLGTAAFVATETFLQVANNLSDLNNVVTARTNLGLGTAATAAATSFLQVANNLSDLANAATARTNLGLGTAATASAASFLQVANNLSDLGNTTTARSNLGLGSIATQASSAVSITGGSVTGITAFSVKQAAIYGGASIIETTFSSSRYYDFQLRSDDVSSGGYATVYTTNSETLSLYGITVNINSSSSSGGTYITAVRQLNVADSTNGGNGITTSRQVSTPFGSITLNFCRGVLTSVT